MSTTFTSENAFVEIGGRRIGKEAERQAFLARAREWKVRVQRMQEIAAKVGLSSHLWPIQNINGKECEAPWHSHKRPGRGTGRTTRMLLSACVDAMNNNKVMICAHQTNYAHELGTRLQRWLDNLGGDPSLVDYISIRMDVLFLCRGLAHSTIFYCDHHVHSRPDLRPLGQKWAVNP